MSGDLNDSCVAEVRAKYAEDLEELLQCPICLVRPTGHVRMCKVGHHLCETCWRSLRECPTCKTPFSPNDGRNFLAEELCSKWNEFSSVFAPPPIALLERTTACRIGLCSVRLPTERVLEHIRDVHPSSLLTMQQSGDKQAVKMEVAYGLNRMYCYCLQAERLGLFFFIYHIDENGNGQLEIQHSCPGADRLRYWIELVYPTILDPCIGSCAFRGAFGEEREAHVHNVGRNNFEYYYKDGGVIDEKKTELFYVSVRIGN